MNPVNEREVIPTYNRDLSATIGRLAAAIAHELTPGDIAALRRLDPNDSSSPAFYRCVAAYVEPSYSLAKGGAVRDEEERKWAIILSGMAQVEHQTRRHLGQVSAEAGLAELRFIRLLRDGGNTLAATVRAVVHFLASKNEHVNWVDLARLIFSEGHDWGEGVRRSIARDYYRQAHRLEHKREE